MRVGSTLVEVEVSMQRAFVQFVALKLWRSCSFILLAGFPRLLSSTPHLPPRFQLVDITDSISAED
jgi:hypothetical protein